MKLLSGNEAIAHGAWEAGVHIGTAYPGTPSTETMEFFATLPEVYAEWCPNEKVALEVAVGASAAGARTLTTMKHVGVNVAADPLFTAAYTGVNGGMLILAADDPGMFSSQNEQDSRYYAMAAHLPLFEPSDSCEAKQFAHDAYDLSERFDTPFMIRTTVRTSHTKSPVEIGNRTACDIKPYETDPNKWVMMPAFAKPRRKVLSERMDLLRAWVETCKYNRIEKADAPASVGVICAGAVYEHVKEALPEVDILKLGIAWPLPAKLLQEFAQEHDDVYVVEEASTFLSDAVKAQGIVLSAFDTALPREGEIHPRDILIAFGKPLPKHLKEPASIPSRPPALCAGCPHRLVFKELSRLRAIFTGDIGCYTLGALPPLSSIDTTLDMGASVSMSHGFELAMSGTEHRPVVGIIGDSTFAHSGFSSLMNTVYNKGGGTICILDNRTTAMTGQQGNPFNGITLQNRESHELDLVSLLEALGVDHVARVDAYDAQAVRQALKTATSREELDVIVFERPCILLDKSPKKSFEVTADCTACGVCITLGCPALSRDSETGCALIDPSLCVACGQCEQYCNFDAIRPY